MHKSVKNNKRGRLRDLLVSGAAALTIGAAAQAAENPPNNHYLFERINAALERLEKQAENLPRGDFTPEYLVQFRADVDSLKSRVDQAQGRWIDYGSFSADLQLQLDDLSERHSMLIRANEGLSESIGELSSKADSLSTELGSTQANLRATSSDRAKWKKRANDLSGVVAGYLNHGQPEDARLAIDLIPSRSERDTLRARLDSLHTLQVEGLDVSEGLESIYNTGDRLFTRLAEADSQRTMLVAEYDSLCTQATQLSAEVDTLNTSIDTLATSIGDSDLLKTEDPRKLEDPELSRQLQEYGELVARRDSLVTQRDSAQEEVEDLETDLRYLDEDRTWILDDLVDVEAQETEERQKLDDLLAGISGVRQDIGARLSTRGRLFEHGIPNATIAPDSLLNPKPADPDTIYTEKPVAGASPFEGAFTPYQERALELRLNLGRFAFGAGVLNAGSEETSSSSVTGTEVVEPRPNFMDERVTRQYLDSEISPYAARFSMLFNVGKGLRFGPIGHLYTETIDITDTDQRTRFQYGEQTSQTDEAIIGTSEDIKRRFKLGGVASLHLGKGWHIEGSAYRTAREDTKYGIGISKRFADSRTKGAGRK